MIDFCPEAWANILLPPQVTFQEMRRAVDKFSEEATIEVPELEELFAHMNIGKNQSFENIIIRNQKSSSKLIYFKVKTIIAYYFLISL